MSRNLHVPRPHGKALSHFKSVPARRFLHLPVLATVVGSLLLTACAGTPSAYRTPELDLPALPATKGAEKGAAHDSKWWLALQDAQLNALIAQAQERNSDLQLGMQRIVQARAQAGMVQANQGPVLGVGAKVMADKLSKNSEMLSNLPLKNVNTDFTNHQLGFEAQWEWDLFGRKQSQSSAALARVQAQEERAAALRLLVAAEVVRHYCELRSLQQRLHLHAQSLHTQREITRLIEIARRAGELSQADVARSQSHLANLQAQQPLLQAAAEQSLHALALLSMQDVQELRTRLMPGTGTERAAPVPNVLPAPATGLSADLLRRRPDLRALEAEIRAAHGDLQAAQAARYPSISLLGSGGWVSIERATLLQAASRTFSIGPSIAFSVLDNGRNQAQTAANQAAFALSSENYRKAAWEAVLETSQFLERLGQNEERRRQLQEAEQALRQQLQHLQHQWRAGEISRLQTLQMEREMQQQQDMVMQSQAQSLQLQAALHKALGGGWN